MTDEHLKMQDHVVVVGEIVADRYEITKHLGTGGFAKVFRAFDRVIERDVAIKFLDLRGVPGGNSMVNTVLERFRREAKLAAKIPHRNVVNIYDIGQLDEQGYRPYIVMELLDGYDLEDQLTHHGAMDARRLLPLYVDCLDALGEAHELGIVHKDLKPSNLFLSNPGARSESLRIVDFGIAHIKGTGSEEHEPASDSKRLTATGQILGTLQYLTPEYIATQTVSPALDVYQMALILVEMLSGDRVIKTDNAFECLRIHTFGLLEIPEYLLESSLGDVLRKALESDHHARYATAQEFADALSKIDPASVPNSPLLLGEPVVQKRTLTSAISSPNINSPRTGEHQRPTTDGFDAPLTSELEAGRPPDEITRHPNISADHKPMRAVINAGETASTPLGDLAATVVPPEMVTLDDMEVPGKQEQGSGKLLAVLGIIALLILLAGGALAMLMSKEAEPARQPEAPVVASDTQIVETDEPEKEVEKTPLDMARTTGGEVPVVANTEEVELTTDAAIETEPPENEKTEPEEKKTVIKKPSTTKVSLVVIPKDATVSARGRTMKGKQTFALTREERAKGVSVQVSHPDYKTQRALLKGKRSKVVIALVPKDRPSSTTKTSATPKNTTPKTEPKQQPEKTEPAKKSREVKIVQ